MLTVTVGIVGGLLLCRGDGGPAAALGHRGEALGGWGSASQRLDALPGARPPWEPGPFLGTRGRFSLPTLWGCGPFSSVSRH